MDGASVALGGFQRRQEKLVARCEAIWYWGVAHGATRESGRYVPLTDADMRDIRETLRDNGAFDGIGLPRVQRVSSTRLVD